MDYREILEKYKVGAIELEDALSQLAEPGTEDMGFANIDTGRLHRTGIPEVIYGSGKTTEQVKQIAQRMYEKGMNILATRVTSEMYEAVKTVVPDAVYNSLARTISYKDKEEITGDNRELCLFSLLCSVFNVQSVLKLMFDLKSLLWIIVESLKNIKLEQ